MASVLIAVIMSSHFLKASRIILIDYLFNEDGQNAMMEQAKSHKPDIEPDPNKGNLKATGESKIAKNLQPVELQELVDVMLADKINGEGGIQFTLFL